MNTHRPLAKGVTAASLQVVRPPEAKASRARIHIIFACVLACGCEYEFRANFAHIRPKLA